MSLETQELSRHLFQAGGLPYVLLGLGHAWATPLRRSQRRGLSPRDPALAETMASSHVLLTRRTDLWSAWVGFNFSHSLGAVLFGTLVLLIGRDAQSFAAQAAVFVPLALAVSAIYLLLAVKYWFRTPILGCALAFGSFLAAWVLAR